MRRVVLHGPTKRKGPVATCILAAPGRTVARNRSFLYRAPQLASIEQQLAFIEQQLAGAGTSGISITPAMGHVAEWLRNGLQNRLFLQLNQGCILKKRKNSRCFRSMA
jgi:hypothetical protein